MEEMLGMEEVKGIIYLARNIVNGKIYVGQTIKTLEYRKNQHIRSAMRLNNKNKYYFHNAIKKYGDNNFAWQVLCSDILVQDLNEREIYYISLYSSFGPLGYNSDSGGNGGRIISQETKNKISSKTKGINNPFYGKKHSKESLKLMVKNHPSVAGVNNPNYGKTHSKETRLKISAALPDKHGEKNPFYGKTHTEETKKKLSESSKRFKGEDKPAAKLTLDLVREIRTLFKTGDFYYRELAERFNVSVSNIEKIINNKAWRE